MGGEATLLAKGIVEKIGLTYGSFTYKPTGKDKVVIEQPIPDHSMGMDLILKALVNPEYGLYRECTGNRRDKSQNPRPGRNSTITQPGKLERD